MNLGRYIDGSFIHPGRQRLVVPARGGSEEGEEGSWTRFTATTTTTTTRTSPHCSNDRFMGTEWHTASLFSLRLLPPFLPLSCVRDIYFTVRSIRRFENGYFLDYIARVMPSVFAKIFMKMEENSRVVELNEIRDTRSSSPRGQERYGGSKQRPNRVGG